MKKELIKELLPYIIGMVILAIAISKIKNLFSFTNEEKEEGAKNYIKQTVQGLNMKNVTLTGGTALAMANALYMAMKGLGTDEQAIEDTFKNIKTNDDFKLLVKEFGVRDGMDLVQWLYDELPTSFGLTDYLTKSPLYTIGRNISIDDLNAILLKNGVTIRI